MRPTPELPSLSRKTPADQPFPSHDPHTATPATFFLSRSSQPPDPEVISQTDSIEDLKDGMYGIQSLRDGLSWSGLAGCSYSEHMADNPPPMNTCPPEADDDHGKSKQEVIRKCVTSRPHGTASSDSPIPESSRPSTPLTSDEPSSLPSSPRSCSNQSVRPVDDISITDDINYQMVASGGEEEKPDELALSGSSSASQLIMPSIKMPTRRPFTERGRAMGRLKVLFAGASGRRKQLYIDHAFSSH